MLTNTTLFTSFYTSISKDVQGFNFPKEILDDVTESCQQICEEAQSFSAMQSIIIELYTNFKALEKALNVGGPYRIPANSHRSEIHSELPRFFGACYSRFIDRQGRIRSNINYVRYECDTSSENSRLTAEQANASLFWLIKQVSVAFSKAQDLPARESTEKQIHAFRGRMLPSTLDSFQVLGRVLVSDVLAVAKALIHEVFYDSHDRLHPSIVQFQDEPYGRHGPGAVADSSKGIGKWDYVSGARGSECFVNHEALPTNSLAEEIPPSRVILVPKDPIKNRIICAEPKELQFGQQGVRTILEAILAASPLTRTSIHLDDQSYNESLSSDYRYATLDLSDASDTLSLALMRVLLPKEVFAFLTRYRSGALELPDGTVLRQYSAFATMGNSVCFPSESLAFWALSLAAIFCNELRIGTYQSVAEILWVIRNNPWFLTQRFRIAVFGDDIIVPRVHFDAVASVLEACGMTVNKSKSCCDSPLRESCGSYYYLGVDCKTVRFTSCGLEPNVTVCNSLASQVSEVEACGLQHVLDAIVQFVKPVIPSVQYGRVSNSIGIMEGWLKYSPVLSDGASYQQLMMRRPVLRYRAVRIPGERGIFAYFTQNSQTASHGDVQRVKWEWVPCESKGTRGQY